jgi:DNA-directed RNA polymerase specialized sigma24 family protein
MNDVTRGALEIFLQAVPTGTRPSSFSAIEWLAITQRANANVTQAVERRLRRRGILGRLWSCDDTADVAQTALVAYIAHSRATGAVTAGREIAYLFGIINNAITDHLYARSTVRVPKDVIKHSREAAASEDDAPHVELPIVGGSHEERALDVADPQDTYAHVDSCSDLERLCAGLTSCHSEAFGIILQSERTGESRIELAARRGITAEQWKSRERVVLRKLGGLADAP